MYKKKIPTSFNNIGTQASFAPVYIAITIIIVSILLSPALARFKKDRKDVTWLKEIQLLPKVIPDSAKKLKPLLIASSGKSISTKTDWLKKSEKLKQKWLSFLGPMPSRKTVPKLTVLSQDEIDGVIRQLVSYKLATGETTQAYLLKPKNLNSKVKRPGIVVFHSTTNNTIRQPAGVEGKPEKAFGLQLAKKGYVTFCPKNFLWDKDNKFTAKASEKFIAKYPRSKGMTKMLYDALVAVDILAAIPGVDKNRIGAIGHSLGAKEVLYLAAFDERIKATISSEGGIGIGFSNWDAIWYLGSSVKKKSFQLEHHELLGMIAPRAFLLIGGNSADGDRSWPFIAEAIKVYKLFDKVPKVGLLNHRKGHSVPPEIGIKIEQWFDTYL